eukprot:2098456-Prymnesium_polylepis.1
MWVRVAERFAELCRENEARGVVQDHVHATRSEVELGRRTHKLIEIIGAHNGVHLLACELEQQKDDGEKRSIHAQSIN